MPTVVGMGDYRYEYHGDWARLPRGQSFQIPSAVAVDSRDRVYVFQREGPPILVFDRDGYLLDAWPRRPGELEDAHFVTVSPDNHLFLTDRDSHQVLKYTTDGKLVMVLGKRYQAALQAPFNHPADVGIAPSGDIYVADGYGNSQRAPVLLRGGVHLLLRERGKRARAVPGAPWDQNIRRRPGVRRRSREQPGAGVHRRG